MAPKVTPDAILSASKSREAHVDETGGLIWMPLDPHLNGSEGLLGTTQNPPRRDDTRPLESLDEGPVGDDSIGIGCFEQKATLGFSFALPATGREIFLPTFFSCLLCRIYTIHVHLAVEGFGTTLSLTTPLQIATEHVHDLPDSRPPIYSPTLDSTTDMLPPYQGATC